MDSESIYGILASKPHNPHYLRRYLKFILSCLSKDESTGFVEDHHICPKSKDLFPEYKSFKKHPWNKATLTGRQHFIAHWMLWKAYGGSQSYAFMSMANGQEYSKRQQRQAKVNSRTYSMVREQAYKDLSVQRRGKANYRDKDGVSIYCRTDDPRVLSGELTSNTLGTCVLS
jgi:hypothetical protein